MPGGIQPPIEELLSWPVPNYIDPPTKSKYILIVACVLGPISIILLLARLWVRIRLQRNAGLDDWLMLASLFPMIAMTVLDPLVVEKYQFNRHIWDVEYDYFPIQRKFVMAIYALFTLASGLVKMSVLLFYRRLSSRSVSPTFRWTMRIMMVVVGGYTIAFILVLILTCNPIEAYWLQVKVSNVLNKQGYPHECINEGADIVANGIISTVQDFIVAFLPSLLCWKLQMPTRQKFALYGIFAIGYSTVAIGALRSYSTYLIYFKTYDVTWGANDCFLYAMLELHIGAICANAPALKVFFKQILSSDRVTKIISRSSKSRSNGSHNGPKQERSNTATRQGPSALVSKSSAWIPIMFLRSSHSTNSNGYISESNTNIMTDKHGGIVKMNTFGQSDSQRRDSDSLSDPSGPEYKDLILSPLSHGPDLEMGVMRDSHMSNISALPPIHAPPPSPMWLRPLQSLSSRSRQ
ncbi:hypothetical protein HBH98_070930 [Parastagonospora nodorum]|nr:hypothetical protein HBH51_132410 [Parastagonospora nodorum]KAH4000011.1 hypothetical protein HBI10_106300 [Parastagonospora nodorum]KAH4009962.1 hypothetical protein HBI13_212370 [Parastagonospora nodorum]KAH4091048.1 hypothetical protein HBH46_188340 [Parastagonospora nodorum]KAH4207062.1 hypothetical protein HBI95_111860 [Parastagonospora nodorum]